MEIQILSSKNNHWDKEQAKNEKTVAFFETSYELLNNALSTGYRNVISIDIFIGSLLSLCLSAFITGWQITTTNS